MKTAGIPIKKFIGLRSKMYSVLLDDGKEKIPAKGVVKNVISEKLKHRIFSDILESGSHMRSRMKSIRRDKHILNTVDINKVCLFAYDYKRWIRDYRFK